MQFNLDDQIAISILHQKLNLELKFYLNLKISISIKRIIYQKNK